MNFWRTIPKRIRLWLHRRKYDHISILGSNCEAAFRFYRHYRFLDSSLFAWSNTLSIRVLCDGLRRFDQIGTGELRGPDPLYQCGMTKFFFHGKAPAKWWIEHREVDAEVIEADRRDLRERIVHLKEKFRRYAEDDQSLLYLYKLTVEDCALPEINERIGELYDDLCSFGSKPVDLLLVVEERFLPRIVPPKEHIFVRTVREFNPGGDVTNHRLGDRDGWTMIFTEFRPRKRLKTKKKFKFEEVL
ncbi:MAG: hypothetical protein PHS41_04380 [Victivallaceae bacterium]|nr:hypothetical protein [Victivallaceae bacterium]